MNCSERMQACANTLGGLEGRTDGRTDGRLGEMLWVQGGLQREGTLAGGLCEWLGKMFPLVFVALTVYRRQGTGEVGRGRIQHS